MQSQTYAETNESYYSAVRHNKASTFY